MPALLKRILVLLLVVRAIAAPVGPIRSAIPSSHHQHLATIRMRCWPPQRLQRFSAASKLLQLYVGKNRIASREVHALPFRPSRPASTPNLAAQDRRAPWEPARDRLAVCMRC